MGIKRSSVSMPMSQAGILGITSGTRLGGVEMEPKIIVGAIFVFIAVIWVLNLAIQF